MKKSIEFALFIFQSVCLTILFVYFYVFMEWLFLVSKPSFMSRFTMQDRLLVLIAAPLVPALLLGLGQGLLTAVGQWLPIQIGVSRWRSLEILACLVPAIGLAILLMLLVENFTLTTLGVGMRDAIGSLIGLYYLLLALSLIVAMRFSLSLLRGMFAHPRLPGFACLLVLGASATAHTLQYFETPPTTVQGRIGNPERRPNIVLFSADGIPAERLSAYGYHLKTSPHLDRLLSRATIFENAFANAGRTTASLTSIMTGKLPTTTKVLFPPHVLDGINAYEHLPATLRAHGYQGIQETVRYYADAEDLNWLHAFDQANRRNLNWNRSGNPGRLSLATQRVRVLWSRLISRVQERASILFAGGRYQTAFQQVTEQNQNRVYGFSDRGRLDRVKSFIENAEGPFLVQLHLMGTHCCNLEPENYHFEIVSDLSREDRIMAVLDNQILDSDQIFGDLVSFLEDRGLMNETLIVYSSDHSVFWRTDDRLPLIIFDPEISGPIRVGGNAQMLDIAPSLLRLIGLIPPDWMEGRSLFEDDPDRTFTRPIFSIAGLARDRFDSIHAESLSRILDPAPPRYGLEVFGMVVCNRFYQYSINQDEILISDVRGHTQPCSDEQLPTSKDAQQTMRDHLLGKGFSLSMP